MKRTFFPFALLATAMLCLAGPAFSQTLTILHNFGDGSVVNDGFLPTTNLTQGSDGNFYGTTGGGGSGYGGTAFMMTPAGEVTILHSFDDGSVVNDGVHPSGLIQAVDGDFYGTTSEGGSAERGTAFVMTPTGQVTILHSFGDGSVVDDGLMPEGNLIEAGGGSFLGVTPSGGSADSGAVFDVTDSGKLTILHSFGDGTVANDGLQPSSGLVKGTDGDYYGMTEYGGSTLESSGQNGFGTVYKVTPSDQMTILHNFSDGSVANDGEYPIGGLVLGKDDNFYGTTFDGGSAGVGTVFKMTPSGEVSILHSFADGTVSDDGLRPRSSLVQGTDGNFYGTTSEGGSANQGTVFEITPAGQVTILHSFDYSDPGYDGSLPVAGLTEGPSGDFYGTTPEGGSFDLGTVFKLTPAAMLNLTRLTVIGGNFVRGIIVLAKPASESQIIAFSSSDPAVASCPVITYVHAKQTAAKFAIQSQPVRTDETVSITASLAGVSGSCAITVLAPTLNSVYLNENPVAGGRWEYATVLLSGPAPAGGETITLSKHNNQYGAVTGYSSGPPGSNGSAQITSITVPAGAASAQFVIATKQVPKTASVIIRGTLNGISRGAVLSITPLAAT